MVPIFKLALLALCLWAVDARRVSNTDSDDSVDDTGTDDSLSTNGNRKTAATVRTTKASTSKTSSKTTCPTGQAWYSYGQQRYCCPGSFYGTDSAAFCGVSCSEGVSGATSTLPFNRTCASTIMITESDYSSKVAAATSVSGTATSPGAAALITAGPLMGVLAVAGGVLLAV